MCWSLAAKKVARREQFPFHRVLSSGMSIWPWINALRIMSMRVKTDEASKVPKSSGRRKSPVPESIFHSGWTVIKGSSTIGSEIFFRLSNADKLGERFFVAEWKTSGISWIIQIRCGCSSTVHHFIMSETSRPRKHENAVKSLELVHSGRAEGLFIFHS